MSKAKFKKKNIFIAAWFGLGLILVLVAFKQFIWDLVGAQNLRSATSLNPPYMRLVNVQKFTQDKKIQVDLRVNTSGNPVGAVDAAIEYDPNVLSIKKEDISFSDLLWVHQINRLENGKIEFSFFSNSEKGEPILKTEASEESTLVSFSFEIINSGENLTMLSIDKANSLFLLALDGNKEDILSDVQGLKIVF